MITLFGFPNGNIDDVIKGTIAILGARVASTKITKKAGIHKAPIVIRKLSQLYSGILIRDNSIIDLHYRDIIDLGDFNPTEIPEVVAKIISLNGKALVIGGDHATTYYALSKINVPEILWLDAHLDIGRKEKLNHSNVLRFLIEHKKTRTVVYGFRGYSSFANELDEAKRINVEIINREENSELQHLLEQSYAISLDVDFFGAEFFSATVFPEIRGESPSNFVDLIRKTNLKARYFDVVEYSPKLDATKKDGKILVQLIAEILASL